ncbi:MAG: hypothetical protein HYR56_35420, partial [Acidobacteria bacterium]|nr:hypothetical protein [Acidobacteriota bacterium]
SAAAGTGSVAVTTTSGCTWTATSNVNWLTITSGASGSGNGSVSFTIAANPSTSARNGTLTIAGLTATVNQSGAVTNRLVRLAPAVGAAGSTVNVPVELVAQGDETALSFSLGYDQALLSNPSATASADASGATLSLNLDQVAQGRIGLRLTLPAGQRLAAGTRQLALITFTLAAAATGPTALNFGDIPTARLVADSAANPLPANYLGGSVAIAQPVASVSAASFSAAALAPEAMVAAFGTRLATRVEAASTLPLPTSLAGTSLRVRDGAGTERLAPLFFVAPGQINYLVPAGTALGTASLTVTSGDGALSLGTLNITSVAPGLFAANANGQGVPAAVALRVKADGAQSFEPVAVFDPARNQFVAVPLDVSAANERVFLILFGTGFRFNSALAAVSANSGGTDLPVSFAGAAGELAGLDQLNVELPRSLSGRGELNLTVTVDGRSSNTLRVLLK